MSQLLDLAIAFASGTAITKLIEWGRDVWKSKKEESNAFSRVFSDVSSVYEKMNNVLATTEANRFLILKAENGGGVPKIGSRLYASVIHEAYENPVNSVKDRYQKLSIDESYIKMLIEVERHGYVSLVVSEMKNNTLLSNVYKSENILYSEVHYLHQDKKTFYYCSIASTKTVNFSSPKARVAIDTAVNNIRNIFKESYK